MPEIDESLQNLGSVSDFEILSHTEAQEELIEFRKGNNDINIQLQRDIEMLSQAIVSYGSSASDQVKSRTLLRAILLLYFGALRYRDGTDKQFHSWSKLNVYCQLSCFPIAAVLLHGSRVLIEFPTDIRESLFDWLMPDKSNWRSAATHGIDVKSKEELINGNGVKRLHEVKINLVNAAASTLGTLIKPEHYGIDIALGGAGKENFFSGNTISANGEHGHLYVHHRVIEGSASQGLLLGIEQSKPNAEDQFGGAHDLLASAKKYSASGGDFFCKPPDDKPFKYVGLRKLPIAGYYDSLYNAISYDDFCILKDAFEKSCVLLTLLPKEEQLHFIKALVASSGNANKNVFQQLFNSYFQKIPRVRQQEIFLLEEKRVLQEEVSVLRQQLAEANEKLSQLARIEALKTVQKPVCLKSLQHFADDFMKVVTQKMGYGAKGSKKEINFMKLRAKLSSTENLDQQTLQRLLKDFISLAVMNRHYRRSGFTHSGRACLDLLNEPGNVVLRKFLFFKHHDQGQLQYDDLLYLVSGNIEPNKEVLCSARYQQAMYTAFEKSSFKGTRDECVLKSFGHSSSVKN